MSASDRPAPQPARDMILFRDCLANAYRAHPPLHTLSLAAARAVAETVRAPWAEGGPAMHRTSDHLIRDGSMSLRIRVHQPSPTTAGVLVYVHGGGWTLFSLNTHDRVMREYAARSGLVVIGIDYSLVPDGVFPRPVDEVATLLRLLRRTKSTEFLGFDATALPLAVGGDSAGGNLAMAAALTLRDAGQRDLLQAVIMNYAVVDCDDHWPSYRLYDGPTYNLTRAEMRAFWNDYAITLEARQDPRACLLRGPLHALPPTLLTIAECDVLHDENVAFAQALADAGVQVDMQVYRGMLHSFLEAVQISPTSATAFDNGAAWLRATFGLSPLALPARP